MYPTARMIFVALAGVPLALVAALFAPGLWLVGGAWMAIAVGLFLLDATIAADPSGLSFAARVPGTIGVAKEEAASVRLRFAGPAPASLEFAVDTGSLLEPSPGRQTKAVADGVATADFALKPLRRGESFVETLWTRWQGPLGLVWKQRVLALHEKVRIVPNIATVKEEARRLFERESGQRGVRAQLRSGEGAEFNALKDFEPGMDRRMIDWKQTAKHGRLVAREFNVEENLHIVFALDTGRQMCEPLLGLPRIDRAIQAMLLLAYVALRLGDRVGIFAFDEKPRIASRTVAGPNAFAALQHVAAQIDYSTAETNFTLGLTQLSGALERRAVVVVFTDFSDTISAELMVENVKRLLARHLVLFVAFRDEELEAMALHEPAEPADVSRAVLADAMLRDRSIVTAKLKRLGVDVIDVPVDRIGTGLLDAYMAVKRGRG
ncbi:MAG: DUF58 domain-containing protein [Rhizomicrobium sp.]